MNQPIIVKKSRLSGRGVFASRTIKEGQIVLSWHPKKISRQQAEALSRDEQHYLNIVDGEYLYMQSPERYVNHSCDPNTKPSGYSDVAIRDIKKGEEVTSDYGNSSMYKFQCDCGSPNCRGLVG